MSDDNTWEDKIIKIKSPEWVHDILPDDHEYFTFLKKVIRHRARQSWFRRITPAVFEHTSLFQRAIWWATDIIEKELFTFSSKSWKHSYSLRPELTAWVVRAYIEHGMPSLPQPIHLYSFEPVFRYDRPQKWRYRQFHQFNAEVIWESDPWIDAQLIHLAWQIFKDLKIDNDLEININYVCSWKERKKYLDDLTNYFEGRKRVLCEDCLRRLEENPMRILDCKQEDCQLIASKAPKMELYLTEDQKVFFQDVLDLLDSVNIPYKKDDSLVRWLDYYTWTIFEIVDKTDEWRQNTLAWWWSYDNLVEQLGWPEKTPACGFWMWIERVINKIKEVWVKAPSKDKIDVFVAQIWKKAKLKALPLMEKLQNLWVHTMWAAGKPSIKGQMRMADKFDARYALIMWQIEVRDWTIILRDMQNRSQEIIPFEKAVSAIIERIWEENLDKLEFLDEIYIEPPEPKEQEPLEEGEVRAASSGYWDN